LFEKAPERKSTVPDISESERRKHPLPPDVFPGARDVASPYGSMRVLVDQV
jgi:hypothetical protein